MVWAGEERMRDGWMGEGKEWVEGWASGGREGRPGGSIGL